MTWKGEGMYSRPSLIWAEVHRVCHTIHSPPAKGVDCQGWEGGGKLGEGHGWNLASRYRLQGTEIMALSSSPHLFARILGDTALHGPFKCCKLSP